MDERDTITEAAKKLAAGVRGWVQDDLKNLCDTILADEKPELEPGVYECVRGLNPAWLIVIADEDIEDEVEVLRYITVDKDDGFTLNTKKIHCDEVTDITPYPKPLTEVFGTQPPKPASRDLMERIENTMSYLSRWPTVKEHAAEWREVRDLVRSHCDPVRVTADELEGWADRLHPLYPAIIAVKSEMRSKAAEIRKD